MPFHIPPIILIAFVIGIAIIITPGVRSAGVRVTPMKVAALAIAAGIAIYSRSPAIGVLLIGPLSLVWFPEAWGNYTGYFQGQYIDQKTPPVIVAIMGWLMLIGFPLLMLWIRFR